MKQRNYVYAFIGVTLAILLPYLLALILAGPQHVFTGFLVNTADGATYLAKMRKGYEGFWQFTLAFTAQPGEGAYLFLFYLFLGHLARLSNLPLLIVYHLARLLGSWLLLWSMWRFFGSVFPHRPELARIAFWLASIGSGMGWLVVLLGQPPSDFWVAEAYPFLSMFTNAHFPLGIALLLESLTLLLTGTAPGINIKLVLAGLLVSIILPFGVVNLLVVSASWLLWEWIVAGHEISKLEWQPLISLGCLGGPCLLYQYWIVQNHPVLRGWNAQNVMISPPIWDFLLSFSPAILLAVFGLVALRIRPKNRAERLMITWFAIGLLLIYFPSTLQRRFMLGWYIPAVGLAVLGIEALRHSIPKIRQRLVPLVFALALPTNLLVVLFAIFGMVTHSPLYYLNRDEEAALLWLREFSAPDSVVLASPDLALWIPGFTGRKVIYGHPLETVQADQEEAWVKSFYRGEGVVDERLLASRDIDYVLVGPKEREIGNAVDYSVLPVVFESGSVQLLSVESRP